jgi:hypothetical protein
MSECEGVLQIVFLSHVLIIYFVPYAPKLGSMYVQGKNRLFVCEYDDFRLFFIVQSVKKGGKKGFFVGSSTREPVMSKRDKPPMQSIRGG